MSRFISALIASTVMLFTFSTAASRPDERASVTGSTPVAPSHLAQQANGITIHAGSWTNLNTVTFTMRASGTGGWLHAQVELRPAGKSFGGHATAGGHAQLISSGSAANLSVRVSGLKNGKYTWQGRVMNSHGTAGPWTTFSAASFAFGIDTDPPATPRITSPTNPKPGHWYRTATSSFNWWSKDAGSGITGYSYSFSHALHAPRHLAQNATSATFKNTPNGRWILHVWAHDLAGNWSALSTYRFNIMRTPPKVKFIGDSGKHFNPFDGNETWTFSLGRWASNVRVEIHTAGMKTPVISRNLGKLSPGKHDFAWSGDNTKGKMVKHGWYWLKVFTSDPLGNHGMFSFGGIQVWPKNNVPYYPEPGRHIVVSLTNEALYAYDGHKLVYQTLVTTGNPALPTPTGHFDIFAKYSPFQFISPWPPGSPYYYAPSWVSYAMEFIDTGYFIHDAPWRTVYGPGSDGPGTPGTNYGGTHGCVNVPLPAEKWLYGWAPIGTPVDVLA